MKNKKRYLLIAFVMIFSLFIFMYLFPPKDYSEKPTPDSGFDSSFDSGGSDFGSSSSWDSDSSGGGSGRSIYDDNKERLDKYFNDGITINNYFKFFISIDHFIMFGIDMLFHSFIILCCYFILNKSKKILYYYIISSIVLFFFPFITLFIIEFFATFIVAFVSGKKKLKSNSNLNLDYKDIDLTPYGIDSDTIHQEIYDIYARIQEAWMNFKLDDVKEILSDELYNQYVAQLNTLEVKNQRNVMSDFKYLDCAIIGIEEKDDTQILDVRLKVNCRDYIIDDNTKKVLRGDKRKLHTYNYELHFERSKDTVITKCPNCGADLDPKGQNITCPYCNSKIVRKSNNLVLRKKEMILQD